MTNNQINYWKLQHEKNVLAENVRHNVATEGLTSQQLVEVGRHNVSSEDITKSQLVETTRHNKAQESYDIGRLAETNRHNVTEENLIAVENAIKQYAEKVKARYTRFNLNESITSNRNREQETNRHNLALEAIDRAANSIKSNYNAAEIRLREQSNDLQADKLEQDWNIWHAEYLYNREKWATELDKWVAEQELNLTKWAGSELNDLARSFIRISANNKNRFGGIKYESKEEHK